MHFCNHSRDCCKENKQKKWPGLTQGLGNGLQHFHLLLATTKQEPKTELVGAFVGTNCSSVLQCQLCNGQFQAVVSTGSHQTGTVTVSELKITSCDGGRHRENTPVTQVWRWKVKGQSACSSSHRHPIDGAVNEK